MCGRMDFGHGKSRMINVEVDRLSSLPDELIHKILSFSDISEAIKTSVLSSRWKFIWTTIPYLNFQDPYTSPSFVSNVLCRRDVQTQVYSLKLQSTEAYCSESFKTVVRDTFSHNVQQLRASSYKDSIMLKTPTRDLPALTTLRLYGITVSCDHNNTDNCIGFLSKCPNLKDFSLGGFIVKGTKVLNICHPRLSNLELRYRHCTQLEAIKVVAPQLKNLKIMYCDMKHLISAPGLTSLVFMGDHPLQLSTQGQGFPSLEKADLYVKPSGLVDAHKIVCLLQKLRNLKFLTLNLEILEFLSSSMEPISRNPSPFANFEIKSVSKSYRDVCLEVRAHEKEATPTETDNYLLDISLSSIFPMVSCEEITVIRKIISAHEHIRKSRAIWGLERKMHGHGRSQVSKKWGHSMKELQSLFGKMMAQIRLRKIESPKLDKRLQELISLLQCIEGLVAKLPASKRDVMQATFYSKCEDAAMLMNYILGLYEDRSDEGKRLINDAAARA